MEMIFTEQNIGLFFMGLFFVAFALFATYKANEQERKESERRPK